MKKLLSFLVLMCVSLSAMASETSVKNAEGVEIWYDFDSSTKTASVTYRGNYYDSYSDEYTGEVVIPSTVTYKGEKYSVTSIGEAAFVDCSALTSITIPEGVTSIGDEAFGYCSALTSIILPDGVTSIGEWTFGYCDALTSITLPESLTSIGYEAFAYCDALTSITLPEGVTSIGNYAFEYCSSLTSITLPESLTSIGDYAFYDCSSLTSITLPEGVTSIGKRTFAYCYSLTSITIPEGVTSIGDYAFYYCYSLTSITSKNTTPPTIGGKYTFENVNKSIPVYVPKSSVDTYKGAEYWKDFTNIVGAYFVEVTAENGTVVGAGAYEENAEATLTVTPAEGYKFVKWSDGVTDNPRTVVVVSDTTFTAEFEIKEYTLTTEAENGTVEGAGTYKHGDEATLTATPAEGYKFVQWSDGVTDNLRTIVVVSDTTFTAEFEIKEYTLTTEAENGTVKGAGTYKHGAKATLTATPAEGYKFVQWSDGVKDNPRIVIVTSDMMLTAEFEIDDTPISDIQTSDVNVRLIGNRVVVEGADDYTVYSVSGQNLGKVESVERGIYIVVVNGKSYKVVAK
jgi:ubiquinone biosynthesis protein COQ9